MSADEIRGIVRTYRYIIERISGQQPLRRKSLRELLSEEQPSVELQDGSRHFFHRDELRAFSEIVPEHLWGSLRLPLVVGKVSGTPVYRVVGCDETQRTLLETLARSGVLEREGVSPEDCVLRYSGVRGLLRRFSSLIILTIVQESVSEAVSREEEYSL